MMTVGEESETSGTARVDYDATRDTRTSCLDTISWV